MGTRNIRIYRHCKHPSFRVPLTYLPPKQALKRYGCKEKEYLFQSSTKVPLLNSLALSYPLTVWTLLIIVKDSCMVPPVVVIQNGLDIMPCIIIENLNACCLSLLHMNICLPILYFAFYYKLYAYSLAVTLFNYTLRNLYFIENLIFCEPVFVEFSHADRTIGIFLHLKNVVSTFNIELSFRCLFTTS